MNTNLCHMLGCSVPIIQAGMGGVARAELAAAVSAAGAFGVLGMVREPAALIEREVAQVRARTDRPFGVNLIPAATEPRLLEAELDAVLALDVPVVFGFWSLDRQVVDRLKSAGRVVVWQIGRLDEATAAERAGVDAIIAQGHEAGGHVRGHVPTLALLSRVVEAVDLPVIAAGGIADGQAMAAALARGADGVACGSAFIVAEESFAHDHHKRRVVEGRGSETVLTDAFVRNWPDGAPVRVLSSDVLETLNGRLLGNRAAELPWRVVGTDDGQDIVSFSTHSPLRTTDGALEEMPIYAGRGIDAITAVRPAAEIVADLVAEATAELARRPSAEAAEAPSSFASPPCRMHELDETWLGFLSKAEIVEALNELVAAERAGTRVCSRFATDTDDPHGATLLKGVAYAEAHWVAMLQSHIRRLGGEPTGATGSFYEKALKREGLGERLRFLNRGQDWVAVRLGELIPKIADRRLCADLEDMRQAHVENIEACEESLALLG